MCSEYRHHFTFILISQLGGPNYARSFKKENNLLFGPYNSYMTTILILKLGMTMFVGSIPTTQLGGLTSVRSFEDEINFHF